MLYSTSQPSRWAATRSVPVTARLTCAATGMSRCPCTSESTPLNEAHWPLGLARLSESVLTRRPAGPDHAPAH